MHTYTCKYIFVTLVNLPVLMDDQVDVLVLVAVLVLVLLVADVLVLIDFTLVGSGPGTTYT